MKEVNLLYSYELDCAQATRKVPPKMRGFLVKTPCCDSKAGHPDPCCIPTSPMFAAQINKSESPNETARRTY